MKKFKKAVEKKRALGNGGRRGKRTRGEGTVEALAAPPCFFCLFPVSSLVLPLFVSAALATAPSKGKGK